MAKKKESVKGALIVPWEEARPIALTIFQQTVRGGSPSSAAEEYLNILRRLLKARL